MKMMVVSLALLLAGCCDEIARCDQDCPRNGGCEREGITCRPRNDEDCARSSDCRTWGLCKRDGDHCAMGGTPW